MNHFDEYTLKILKCTENLLTNFLDEIAHKSSTVVIKKRNSKNCVIYYIQLNAFSLANIKTDLYRKNIPFFIRATISFYGVGVCWVLNANHSLSNINPNKARCIDWFEQDQRYKTYKLLKITG